MPQSGKIGYWLYSDKDDTHCKTFINKPATTAQLAIAKNSELKVKSASYYNGGGAMRWQIDHALIREIFCWRPIKLPAVSVEPMTAEDLKFFLAGFVEFKD